MFALMINKGRICRGHLTENSLDGHLTDDDKKKVQQDKETEICPYSPIVFFCISTNIKSNLLVQKNLVEKA